MTSEQYPPCPKCGGYNFKVWKLPSPVIVHWVLNPGLAFNELVLGQRLPKVQLICKDCPEPLYDRSYVPCPHCNAMNRGRTWGKKRGFGNWLGYVCPACGKRIPCLWNYTSLVILAATSPVWYLPYRYYFRDRIPEKPAAFAGDEKPLSGRTWLRMGIFWGFAMWLIMSVIPELKNHFSGHGANWHPVLIGIPVWGIAGALFGSLCISSCPQKLGGNLPVNNAGDNGSVTYPGLLLTSHHPTERKYPQVAPAPVLACWHRRTPGTRFRHANS